MNDKTELQKHEAAEAGRKRVRKEKKKGKNGGTEAGRRWLFLAVDLLLVIAIVGAVVFISISLSPSAADEAGTEVRTVIYQIEIAGVDADLFGVSGGETVINAADGSVLGVVEYCDDGQPYTKYSDSVSQREDGKYFVDKIEYPEDIKTYVVTVRAQASYLAGVGYYAEDCRLAVGRSYQLRIADHIYTGECIALQPASGN